MSCTMQRTQMELSITGEAMKSAVKSFTLSKRYVQIVVRASILNILYRRISITDACLRTKKLENLPFVAFKSTRKVKDPMLNMYISWMDGIKDAISKNYLSEIFIFMKNKKEDVLETYRFAMRYNTDQTEENQRTLEYVKEDTMALFQVILDLGKIEKLSRDILIDIEFTYTDITPADYEPPGFMAAVRANCLRNHVYNVHLGTLNTGYHKLTCRAQGLIIDERALTPLISSHPGDEDCKENIDMVEMDQEASKSVANKKNVPPNKKIIVHEEIIILDDGNVKNKERSKFNTSNITISDFVDDNVTILSDASSHAGATAAPAVLDCVCELTAPLDTVTVGCAKCARRCHAPCAGFYHDDDAASCATFRCNRCVTTDTIMASFNASEANLLAIIRLILFFSNKNKALPGHIIELVDESRKKMIFQKLKEFGIYMTDPKTGRGSFNTDNSERAAPLFFNTDNSQFLH